jgi:zinc transport system substrate-binding protein
MVNTSKAFKENYINIDDAVTHSHGMDGDHSHSGTAFTTWLDLRQAVMQAEIILKALSRKLPEEKEKFESNFRLLEKDLLTLDNELEKITSKASNLPLVASHPVYQYFGIRLESTSCQMDDLGRGSES